MNRKTEQKPTEAQNAKPLPGDVINGHEIQEAHVETDGRGNVDEVTLFAVDYEIDREVWAEKYYMSDTVEIEVMDGNESVHREDYDMRETTIDEVRVAFIDALENQGESA